jgi:hypothetical protein
MKGKIAAICFALIMSFTIMVGISHITDKPIIFERVNIALYDGMLYYQNNYGYTEMNKSLVYFQAYKSLVASGAVVIFRSRWESPIFCIIYTPGPNQAEDGRGWIDDNCDGKFRSLVITDEAEIPECYKKEN